MKSIQLREHSTAGAAVLFSSGTTPGTTPDNRRLCIALLAILCSWLSTSVAYGQPFGDLDEDELRRTRLTERLVHDGELARLLNLARAEIRAGRSDTAVAALRQVFASPIDTYYSDSSGRMQSLRAAARQLLITSPGAFQIAWRNAMEPVAGRTLTESLEDRDHLRLYRTAVRFPLTNSGFRAYVIYITHLIDIGNSIEAAAAAEEFSSLYSETQFSTRARQAMSRWTRCLRRGTTPGDDPSGLRHLQTSTPSAQTADQVSRPWPFAVWKWTENGRSAPLHFRPALINAMDRYRGSHSTAETAFSDYSPVRWGGVLILRTPLRIVGLSRETGQAMWEVATRTTSSESSALSSPPPLSLLDTAGGGKGQINVGLCGMMAAESNMLFFVDGFDLEKGYGRSSSRFRRGLGIGRPRFPEDSLSASPERVRNAVFGTRIVALARRADDVPVIAWVAGEQPSRPYVVNDQQTLENEAHGSNRTTTDDDSGPLQGHLFYSAPCGNGDDLFILSLAEDQVWLNCIRKSNGQVTWQQPICMKPESTVGIQSGFANSALPGRCIQQADTVICCIADGIVASVSASTGVLNWALTVEAAVRQPRMRTYSFNQPQVEEQAAFIPVVHDEKLIWSSSASSDIYCIDTSTGSEIWHISKQAAGPGNIASSSDAYCVGVRDNQVIMIGKHHCRSLALADGIQNWSVELRDQTGRAAFDGAHCLIPESPVGMTMIDVKTGEAERIASNLLPAGYSAPAGAVTVDSEFVTVTTPGSVNQFRRADILIGNVADSTGTPLTAKEEIAAVLLAKGSESAVERSRQIMSRGDGHDAAQVAELSADLALNQIIALTFTNGASAGGTAAAENDAAERIRSLWQHLQSIPLSSTQRVRATLMRYSVNAIIGTDDSFLPAPKSELVAWHQPQLLNHAWSVRPDLLLHELSEGDREEPVDPALLDQVLQSTSRPDTILFAASRSDSTQNLMVLNQWARQGRLVDAELLSCVMLRDASPEFAREIRKARQEFGLRSIPDLRKQAGSGQEQSGAGDASVQQSTQRSKQRVQPLNFVITEEQVLGNEEHMLQAVMGARPVASPLYHDSILLCLAEFQRRPVIIAIDLKTGAVTDRVEVPPSQSKFATAAHPDQFPGLLITAGETSITAIHCRPDGQLQRLWIRRMSAGGDERFVRRLGMFGPDFLVWQSESRLHCAHPLTGADLWTRESSSVEPEVLMLSPPLLFGDERVTVTVGADLRSWTSYSTRTGRTLGRGALGLDRSQSIVATGSRLIGVAGGTSDMKIVDFSAGDASVSTIDPVQLAGDATFRVLPSGDVVAISRDREIVVMDPETGEIRSRNSVAGTLAHSFIFGFTAFERNGKLLVAVNDERGFGQNLSAAPRLGEPRCDFGRLYCIDRETGKIIWQRQTQPMVFTHLPGVDLLVGWAHFTTETGFRRRSGRRNLVLRIYDLQSGDLLGSNEQLIADIPFLGLHDATTGRLTLHTARSRIIASPADSDSYRN